MLGSRRSFFSSAWWSSLLRWAPAGLFSTGFAAARATSPYEELGIRPILNFRGTHTTIGASKQWPELHEAMQEASRHFVALDELQDKVGKILARLIGTEAAMVTSGAAGAICAGTCASVAGSDPARIRRLPNIEGMKNEAIILKLHRNGYDHAVRNSGARIIEVETAEQLRAAINERTAMMYFLGGASGDHDWPETLDVKECLSILKPAGVPLMVDAANMLPPWENLRKLAALGVDLICVSGGKHMRGPQCSGILAGRADLVASARLNTSPYSDSLGRPMKVGREEMIGVWLAAEKYSKLNFEALDRDCLRQAEFLKTTCDRIPGVTTGFQPFDRTRKVRRLHVRWDEASLGLTAAECEKQLMEGAPRIAVQRHSGQGIVFTVFMNDPGDEQHAARRLTAIFDEAKRRKQA